VKKSNVVAVVLASAAAGIVMGILLAPDKGSKTVNKVAGMISDNLQKMKDYVDKFAQDISGGLPSENEMSFAKQSDVADG